MTEATVQVVEVPEGSVLVLRGVELDHEVLESFVSEVERVVGHTRFTTLLMPTDGDAEVWGPDADLSARVRRLLAPPARGHGEGEKRGPA